MVAETAQLKAAIPTERARRQEVERILGLEVPVAVTLAERDMSIQSIVQIKVGTILEFDLPFNSDLILQVNNHAIGQGLAVKVGENFGLRLTRIGTVRDRIGAMAAND
jgi:flagellar motor switch protein FliN/FliY